MSHGTRRRRTPTPTEYDIGGLRYAAATGGVPMAQVVQGVPSAAVPEALPITDEARDVVLDLQAHLNEAFRLRTGQLPTLQKQSGLGCLASAVMDIFVHYVDLMVQNAQPIGHESAGTRSTRIYLAKELRNLQRSIHKAHDALQAATRGYMCRGINGRVIQRRGTRRRGLLSRVRRLGRRRSTRRARA